jgi:hypothetical protein
MNLGGALPGVGTMGIFGGMRYTNAVFAEDEAGLPSNWKALSVEQSFSEGSNLVTVVPVSGATNIQLTLVDATTAENAQLQWLFRIAGVMGGPGGQNAGFVKEPGHTSGVVLLGRSQANELAKIGWTKEKVKAFLWENSKIPWSEIVKVGRAVFAKEEIGISEGQALTLSQPIVVVAGGDQSGHAYWMQVGKKSMAVSKGIKLPAKAKWDELLKQAEKDLGPIPN